MATWRVRKQKHLTTEVKRAVNLNALFLKEAGYKEGKFFCWNDDFLPEGKFWASSFRFQKKSGSPPSFVQKRGQKEPCLSMRVNGKRSKKGTKIQFCQHLVEMFLLFFNFCLHMGGSDKCGQKRSPGLLKIYDPFHHRVEDKVMEYTLFSVLEGFSFSLAWNIPCFQWFCDIPWSSSS